MSRNAPQNIQRNIEQQRWRALQGNEENINQNFVRIFLQTPKKNIVNMPALKKRIKNALNKGNIKINSSSKDTENVIIERVLNKIDKSYNVIYNKLKNKNINTSINSLKKMQFNTLVRLITAEQINLNDNQSNYIKLYKNIPFGKKVIPTTWNENKIREYAKMRRLSLTPVSGSRIRSTINTPDTVSSVKRLRNTPNTGSTFNALTKRLKKTTLRKSAAKKLNFSNSRKFTYFNDTGVLTKDTRVKNKVVILPEFYNIKSSNKANHHVYEKSFLNELFKHSNSNTVESPYKQIKFNKKDIVPYKNIDKTYLSSDQFYNDKDVLIGFYGKKYYKEKLLLDHITGHIKDYHIDFIKSHSRILKLFYNLNRPIKPIHKFSINDINKFKNVDKMTINNDKKKYKLNKIFKFNYKI